MRPDQRRRLAELEALITQLEGSSYYHQSSPDRRADELLNRMLTSFQRETWRELGYIDCVGSLGTQYRIKQGAAQRRNVEWRTRTSRGSMCAHPTFAYHHLPQADLILGQLLTLVSDEGAFLKVAEGPKPPVFYKKNATRGQKFRRFFRSRNVALFCLAISGLCWLSSSGLCWLSSLLNLIFGWWR